MAQILGAIGICLLLATFQFNNRRIILRIQMASGLVWATQYILLGAFTGSALNALMAGRNYLFDRYPHKQIIFWFSLIAIVCAGLLTWQGPISLLPLAGGSFATIAMWQSNPRHIRLLMLAVPPFWFIYNLLVGSYFGMLGDTITFCSVLVGIYRFDIQKITQAPPADLVPVQTEV